MMSRKLFYFIVCLLIILGSALMLYRHIAFEVPWYPNEQRESWQIEAKIQFTANDEEKPITLNFSIPKSQNGYTILSESAASPNYGVSFYDDQNQGKAKYTTRLATGKQELFYIVKVLRDPNAKDQNVIIPQIDQDDEDDDEVGDDVNNTAKKDLINLARERSADTYSQATELFKIVNSEYQNAQLLLKNTDKTHLLAELLLKSKIPTRIVHGLTLEDKRRRQPLVEYLQIFDGKDYQYMNPDTGAFGKPDNLLLWEYNDQPIIDLSGGRKAKVTFAMLEKDIPVENARKEKFEKSSLINFSLDLLPIEEQSIFNDILLLPIGVLVVVFLRILVGIKTSGTFMPVLIAMAFMKTHLVVGVIGLLSIVSIGLLIRFYLSRLNLLLVARISTVIITVIGIITFLTVSAYQFGITEGMKITFFPMIILSWTIERMSILWEEEGAKQVFVQGGGSLLVAILAYLAISSTFVAHLTFNFLGLQLIIVAIVLLLGNYTGYRLSELKRFKPLVVELEQKNK